eukprot:scaffold1014_cov260-Pinguiococcus_pyrenoidosus.AAC.14
MHTTRTLPRSSRTVSWRPRDAGPEKGRPVIFVRRARSPAAYSFSSRSNFAMRLPLSRRKSAEDATKSAAASSWPGVSSSKSNDDASAGAPRLMPATMALRRIRRGSDCCVLVYWSS